MKLKFLIKKLQIETKISIFDHFFHKTCLQGELCCEKIEKKNPLIDQ